jgi:RNA polymerase sigma-70 factor, ECF subfamily
MNFHITTQVQQKLHLLASSSLELLSFSLSNSITMKSMDPLTQLKRIQQLDGQALAELHDEYYPHIYRYLCYRLEDLNVVEDISSEVFLRLLGALKEKKGPLLNLKGWLLGTAAHLVQDHLRSKYRQREEDLEDHEHIPASAHTEKEVEKLMERQEIYRAIQTLSAEQQHVLALRFSQELSIEETAQIMGKNISAVKVLQFRALASLRRKMK